MQHPKRHQRWSCCQQCSRHVDQHGTIIKAGDVKYRIDFFAAEVITGVQTMKRYVALMEEQLAKAATDDRKRIDELANSDQLDEADWQLELQIHGLHYVKDFPAYLRYSFVVFALSFFDSRLLGTCV